MKQRKQLISTEHFQLIRPPHSLNTVSSNARLATGILLPPGRLDGVQTDEQEKKVEEPAFQRLNRPIIGDGSCDKLDQLISVGLPSAPRALPVVYPSNP